MKSIILLLYCPGFLQNSWALYSSKFATKAITTSGINQASSCKIRTTHQSMCKLAKADSSKIQNNIIKLAIPAFLALSIDPLMSVVDTILVSNWAGTDPLPLAAIGTSTSVLTFTFYIFNFLSTATTPLIASKRAQNENLHVETIGGQALTFSITLGLLVTGFLVLLGSSILQQMGSESTGATAASYAFLSVRALAAPAVFLGSASIGILRGCSDTSIATLVLLAANGINCLLDFLLIFGLNLGPTGAAIATTTAEWTAALLFLVVLSSNSNTGNNNWTERVVDTLIRQARSPLLENPVSVRPQLSLPAWGDVAPLLRSSAAVFSRTVVLQACLSSAAFFAANLSPADSAATTVAAHQVALQVWLLCSFAADALAAAAQPLVADALVSPETPALEVGWTILRLSLVWGFVLTGVLGLGLILPPHPIPLVFSSDPYLLRELAPVLSLVVLSQPLNAAVFALDGVLQGAQQFVFQAWSMALAVSFGGATFFAFEHWLPSDVDQQLWMSLSRPVNYFLGTTSGLSSVDATNIEGVLVLPILGASEANTVLLHLWVALTVVQLVRGASSWWKLPSALSTS